MFVECDPAELVQRVDSEPTGQSARRAGFLFEWLTDQILPIRAHIAGAFVDAIDADKVVAATKYRALPNRRWRVRDNLPGTRYFCPMVRKAAVSKAGMALDIAALMLTLVEEFGEELLMKSAVWMTLRESRSSFAIEGEADKSDRIQRFADVLARRTGQGPWPLDQLTLAEMQTEILGSRNSVQRFGIRQSPVFVGEVIRSEEIVHYVGPPVEDLAAMLGGLAIFLDRTQGQSPVMRGAVVAFGFVYIHPLADGNGRLHRFLINDVLRRDGVLKEPMILPVSSLISSDSAARRAYDQILDAVSKPLMLSVAGQYRFTPTRTRYPDGMASNFVFDGDASARHIWRFLDLTSHVNYLAHVLERTIQEDMCE